VQKHIEKNMVAGSCQSGSQTSEGQLAASSISVLYTSFSRHQFSSSTPPAHEKRAVLESYSGARNGQVGKQMARQPATQAATLLASQTANLANTAQPRQAPPSPA